MTRRHAFGRLAELHRELAQVYEELAVDDLELVDVLERVPHARLSERRAALRACRTGGISNATKISRRWKAPQASILAWLRTLGPRLVPDPPDPEADELEDVRARLLGPTKARAPRRARARGRA